MTEEGINKTIMLDKTILERLFRRHYSDMISLARTLLCDSEEAEDVVQDVFARLLKTDIEPAADRMRAYLMTAVCHGCSNTIRRKALHQRVENLYPVGEKTDFQPVESMNERLDLILMYARQLKEPHRSIFHLRFKEDLTLKQIALHMGLNPNTVYKYLQQSIGQIRSKLNP